MQAAFTTSVPILGSRSPTLSTNVFVGARPSTARPRAASVNMKIILPVFTQAMEEYKRDYPEFAKKGWGATVKAEVWNGRHAMVGLLIILITGYCKGHNLLPPATPLDTSVWGGLAALGDYQGITIQRAAILIGHVHLLLVSVGAAFSPLPLADKLLLEDGEVDAEPAGLFPAFVPGLNKDAEMWNGRVAMLGVISLVSCSLATQTSILDTLNIGLGGLLF